MYTSSCLPQLSGATQGTMTTAQTLQSLVTQVGQIDKSQKA